MTGLTDLMATIVFVVFVVAILAFGGYLIYIFLKKNKSINFLADLQKIMFSDAMDAVVGREDKFGFLIQKGDSTFECDGNRLGKIVGLVEMKETLAKNRYSVKIVGNTDLKTKEKLMQKIYMFAYIPGYRSGLFSMFKNMFKKKYLLIVPESRVAKPLKGDISILANSLVTVYGSVRTINDLEFYKFVKETVDTEYNKQVLVETLKTFGNYVDQKNDISQAYTQIREMKSGQVPSGTEGVNNE